MPIVIPLFGGAQDPSQIEKYLNDLIVQLNQIFVGSQGLPGAIVDLNTSFGSVTLFPYSGTIYIHNAALPLTVNPPPLPIDGLTYEIYDADGTSGTWNIIFGATVNGVPNPVIIDVAFATARLQFHNNSWNRI